MANTRPVTALSSLYVSLALLGIAALAGAATSSLFAGAVGTADQGEWPEFWRAPGWQLTAGIATAGYSLATLAYALVSFRRGTLPRTAVLQSVVFGLAGMHLVLLLAGIWRMPEDARSFDVTLAALTILELSVSAVLGWRRNLQMRRGPSFRVREPSAPTVVGGLFAVSLLVAAITTSGMAASAAGQLAVPHSGHHTPQQGTQQESPEQSTLQQQLKEQGHHH